MKPLLLKISVALFLFLGPLLVVCVMNWEQAKPYFVADAESARRGELLYFARRG